MESPGIAKRIAETWLAYGYTCIQTIMVTGELSVIDGFFVSRRTYERISCSSSISLADARMLKYMDNFQAVAIAQIISFKPLKGLADPIASLSRLALNGHVRVDLVSPDEDAAEDDIVFMHEHERRYEVQYDIRAVYDFIEKRRCDSDHHQYTFQVYCDARDNDIRVIIFEIADYGGDPEHGVTTGVLTWTEPDGLVVVCRENLWQGLRQMSLF